MNKEVNIIQGLKLKHRQIKEALRIIIHSILFQRELGIVTPRTIESECGIHYLTLNDINTDKVIEEQLSIFQQRINDQNCGTLILSFCQNIKRKSFLLFQENSKLV